jgi:hypothetical protein
MAENLHTPWSLAWSVLALAGHGRPVKLLLELLRVFSDTSSLEDTTTLALAALAFDYRRALLAFGVVE